MPNAEQKARWTGAGGRHWAAEAERHDRMLAPYRDQLLDVLALRPGERVLDVGCGNAALTLAAATLVAPEGEAVGVDISTPMLAQARQRANDAEVTNVSFVEADAQVHPFDPDAFDALTSRFGVMFFDDPIAAFTNLRGALRRGARVAFTCWQDLFRNEWLMVPAAAALEHVPMPDLGEPGAPGPFSLSDPDRVRSVLTGAGFASIEIDERSAEAWMGADTDDAVEFLRKTGFAEDLMAGVDDDTAARAWDAIATAVAARQRDDGIYLGGAAWLVTATATATTAR